MTVRKIKDSISESLRRIQRDMDNLPKDAYNFFVKTTPIKTGRARRSTRLKGDTIDAHYPYAVPLDNGHSKQAPEGMTKPTEDFIQRRLNQIMRKK